MVHVEEDEGVVHDSGEDGGVEEGVHVRTKLPDTAGLEHEGASKLE